MSLRARLIIGVVALAAVGLLVAGAVTYAEQRRFQFDRIDDQVDAALPFVRGAYGPTAPGGTRTGDAPGAGDSAPVVADAGKRPPGVPGGAGLGGPPHGPGAGDRPPRDRERRDPGGAGASLPAALYGEARDAAGRVLGHGTPRRRADDTVLAAPKLPQSVRPGTPFNVGSQGASGLRYRVLAEGEPGGGLTIAAIPLTEVDASLDSLLLVEALVIGGVLVALGLGAWWIVALGLRPLDRIGATAGAIAAGDLARRVEPAEEHTEIGRLGLSLNAMLARLEEAFAERRASEERLRRFLADASHELRTPLSSIRGYAELFRIGAAAKPADVEKAMARIEDESARMGVLVEDLLALARLDEVREQVREPVDLVVIAGDAVDDARAVAPEREISLLHDPRDGVGNADRDVDGDGDGDGDAGRAVVVDADPGQLRQVLANLVRNALVHTPPATPIEVSVSARDGEATLAVRDFGPGLPTSDPRELFDRFWRADPGRGRGRAGAGLGLAIVAGIVAAHGGRASAADVAGGGARFEVVLPLRPPGGAAPTALRDLPA